ncbi:S24 family peptidase [Labilibaculum sp.]|uniref:LexA family transcriptional regulator n=1 Tax=Labilibaculum sp. TaxID=2060723 RepID=UPI002AA946CF|nr:S24 family peptidase [Labilibaculum sp.]
MKTNLEIDEILIRLKEALKIGSDAELSRFLEVSKSTLSNWKKRGSIDYDLLFSKCEHLSKDWLLTGQGMQNIADVVAGNTTINEGNKRKYEFVNEDGQEYEKVKTFNVLPIPFVSVNAIAGFGNGEFSIAEQDVKDYYVIPKFKDRKIDFMIEVCGSSMYPKYNSGDVVACRIIKESNFIQWNKVHVIATAEQGILIKRLKKSEIKSCMLAVSDNKDYEPFDIPMKEITGIAIVVGVIRLE